MRAVVWITERSWEACVDGAAAYGPADAEVTLLVMPSAETEEVVAGGRAGLFGRRPPPEPAPGLRAISEEAAQGLLDDARERLGREARTGVRRARAQREGVAPGEGADPLAAAADGARRVGAGWGGAALLVRARGGGRRPGPRSLGRHGRCVVAHAPCRVLLVWSVARRGVETIPPPPRPPPGEEPPRPPHEAGPPPPP